MDIRQEITNKIIAIMERGQQATQELWVKSSASGFPINASTGKQYNGINILILWNEAAENGYEKNLWLTYKQAAAMGAQVRKGEKGTMCAYFEMMKKKDKKTENQENNDESEFFPMCKPFWVFNVAQIDGLPEEMTRPDNLEELPKFSPIESAEKILASSGAVINHGGNRAFYSISKDEVFLPERERFTTPENYYAVGLHELTHWTGHKSRLDRKFGKRFGDNAYAFEELVAELGAAFVIGHCGLIGATIENHANYLNSWIKVLKEDKTAIFTAAKNAGQAFDFLMEKAGLKEAQPEA